MKKILIISLFGLSVGLLDVHLYALDTSFVKKTELKKIESEYKQAEKYDGDLSVAQAEKICADYESWAEKHNTKHAYITDVLRKYFGRNQIFFSILIPSVLFGSFIDLALLNCDFGVVAKECTKGLLFSFVLYLVAQKIEFMRRCKRLLTDQEEAKIQAALQKYGYSEAQACELSKKIFIMNDNLDCDGIYSPGLDCIGLKEYIFKYHDAKFSHILLHELEHYKHCVGHIFCDPQSFFFSPKEEQRADTEAMKKLQKYNQENVLTNLGMGFGNYTHLLNKGYLAHSPAVRNCIAYKVQKQKIEAQFM
jgi:hypothetical protein